MPIVPLESTNLSPREDLIHEIAHVIDHAASGSEKVSVFEVANRVMKTFEDSGLYEFRRSVAITDAMREKRTFNVDTMTLE